MNFSAIKQARELKSKLDKAQKELNKIIVEADAGKGAVKVSMNGQQKVLSVKIAPELLDPNKPQRVEELLTKAVNDAIEKSQKAAAKQLSALTGGLKIPGLT
ncbi:MAG: YbaB/EbfC family nucleoid-associated protein [Chloroflexi bacterium]|nr:YbaB/EbfC family nucleoid-associated protein [Chloroflexota bacterium]